MKIVLFLCVLALVGSWSWFLVAQKRMEAQLSRLISKEKKEADRNVTTSYKDEAVKNAIRKQAPAIQKLWQTYLRQKPSLTEGSIELDWQITAEGKVQQVSLIHSDFADSTFNQDVLKLIQTARFPAPPTGLNTYVAHTFKFKKD